MSAARPLSFGRWALYLPLAVLALWLAGFGFFAAHVMGMRIADEKTPADAIIVLTGGSQRVNKGLDLLARGEAPQLFISGVGEGVKLEEILDFWDRPIITPEKSECCVVLGRRARNTFGNAFEVKEWADKEDMKSIRLVTSDYHMPRALVEFRSAMPDLTIIPYPVRGVGRDGEYFRLLFGEYNKTLLAILNAWRS